jgi:hypothetical protein
MKILPLLFLVSACLLLSGCAPSSLHPLYTDRDTVTEPALEGTWSSGPDDKDELVIQKSGDHEYDLVISCTDQKVICTDAKVRQDYAVHLVRLGGQLFVDLSFKGQTVSGVDVDGPIGVIPAHAIAKVKLSGDDLAYATLEDKTMQKIISGGSPLDYQMLDGSMLLTAQTDALRSFISAHADDVFSSFEHLERKKACPTCKPGSHN